jgi:hypothetical protein
VARRRAPPELDDIDALAGSAESTLLFDSTHYERACRRRFHNAGEALRHYLSIGEERGLTPGPIFDTAHYRTQLDDVPPEGLLRHYCRTGYREGLSPTPFFEPEWYQWQNPDSTDGYDNPYLHYLDIGRKQGRDPSPLVDMVRYQQATEGAYPRERLYELILSGQRSVDMGVYEGWDDLRTAQANFRRAISLYAAKCQIPSMTRRSLVFLQCGSQSRHREWITPSRDWDLLVNYYDAAGYDPDLGEYVFFQPGTKFTAADLILKRYPDILFRYDYVLFLDDDIVPPVDGLNRFFDLCRQYELDLAQLSLSRDSWGIWDIFYSRSGSVLRYVTGVEIMMPAFSRRALEACYADFGLSISGFGLDLLFSKKLLNAEKPSIAVIDEVAADHSSPIDQNRGAYYSYLRSRRINAKSELWYLIKEYNLARTFVEL